MGRFGGFAISIMGDCMGRRIFLSAFVLCILSTAGVVSAGTYQTSIWGTAGYFDPGDMSTVSSSFYNPVAGVVTKANSLDLGGLTHYSAVKWAAESYAMADICTGELKIKAAASDAGFASAGARLIENITFTGAYNGVLNGQPCYSIPASFVVSGIINGDQTVSAGIKIGSMEMHQKVISGTMTIFAGLIHTTGTLDLNIYINTDGFVSNGLADFTNTAKFRWQLPDGISYQCSSGMFLNPEPSTMLILLPGLLALIRSRRK